MTGRKRLLVLDDEKDFADYVVAVATFLGYAAAAAYNARDFQALYLEDPPDVVVLDVVMPEQDGIEMIGWLAAQGCRAQVLVASGYNPLFAKAVKVLGEGVGQMTVTTLDKPVQLAVLRRHLTQALELPLEA